MTDQANRLRQMADLARSMSSSLDLEGVLTRVTEAVAALRRDLFCAIRLLDEREGGYALAASSERGGVPLQSVVPLDRGLTHVVAERRRPLLLPDLLAHQPPQARAFFESRGLEVYYGVPIEVGNTLVGVLNVAFPREAPPDGDERELIDLLAAQAGVAIRNARLFAESEARRRAAEALADVSRILAQDIDADLVGLRVVTSVRSLLGTQSGILFRLDPDSGDLVALAFAGSAEPYGADLVFPRGTGVAGLAARDRVPVATPDNLGDPRVVYAPEVRRRVARTPDRAVLAVPLLIKDRVIGALSVGDRVGRAYDEEAVRLAQAFADHAALALEKAWLYREAREADCRKDEFLAMLAHELRNPLGPILNALHVLEHVRGNEAQAERLRAILRRQTRQLARLVDDLLDISRIRSGKITLRLEAVDLRDVVHRGVEALRLSGKGGEHDVTLSVPDQPVVVTGDPVRLEQIVGNLLDNAVKYSLVPAPIRVTLHREGDEAVIRVEDRGIGIAPDVLPHVFELFTQADTSLDRSQGGLGVGLPLVLNLVKQHGGTVSAHSEGLDQGSEFVVRLPLRAISEERAVPASPVGVTPRRVLVVEDNADARQALSELLQLDGHRVALAEDGPSGIARVESDAFDLALIDIGLPGLDGYEVARRLRAMPMGKDLYLVALTGYGQMDDRRLALEAGFDAHLVKPLNPDDLARLLSHGRSLA